MHMNFQEEFFPYPTLSSHLPSVKPSVGWPSSLFLLGSLAFSGGQQPNLSSPAVQACPGSTIFNSSPASWVHSLHMQGRTLAECTCRWPNVCYSTSQQSGRELNFILTALRSSLLNNSLVEDTTFFISLAIRVYLSTVILWKLYTYNKILLKATDHTNSSLWGS